MTGFGLFQSAGLDYAVPLGQILRIVENAPRFVVPGLPAAVRSVLVHEATLVPVFAPGHADAGETLPDASECHVLVDSEYGPLALSARSNGRIVKRDKGLQSFPSTRHSSWEAGEFYYQERIYKILDVDVLATEIAHGYSIQMT